MIALLSLIGQYWGRQSPLLSHSVITLYLAHFQRSLIALPLIIFLLWLFLYADFNPTRYITQSVSNIRPHPSYLFSILLFICLNIIAIFAYHRLPQGDAIGLSFQAKIFALGKLSVPAPPFPEFFMPFRVHVQNGNWFSFYPPGHALLLSIGYVLKVPWLIGPILGTCTFIIIYLIALRQYGREVALLTSGFALLSPFFLFLNASYDFHISSLFITSLSLYLVLIIDRNQNFIYGLLLGFILGFGFLSRPYTIFLISVVILIYFIITNPRPLIFMAIGVLPLIIVQLLYNKLLLDDFFAMPYRVSPAFHGIGFSATYGGVTFNIAGHTPVKAMINLAYNLFTLSLQLFGWPLLSLLFFLASFFLKKDRFHLLLLGITVALFIGHFFYWFHGVTPYGPKYVAEVMPAFFILSSLGLHNLKEILSRYITPLSRPRFEKMAANLVFLLFIFSISIYIPYHFFYFQKGKWGETTKIYDTVTKAGIKKALIFVSEKEGQHFIYTSGFIHNDPELKADIIFARDLGKENIKLKRYYPDRSFYRYNPETSSISAVFQE